MRSPFNARRAPAKSSRVGSQSTRRDASTSIIGMSANAPQEKWNGKEGGPGLVPINGLITNSFIPAFNRLSYNGRLRYGVSGLNATGATGGVGNYFFSANGLFDPNVSGGSLQPAGFAQLMTSYDHYVVTKSRCSVIFTNNMTTTAVVALRLDSDTTGTTDPNNLLEMPQAQIVTLEPLGVYGSTKTLTLDFDTARYNGMSRGGVLSDPVMRGDIASNPVEQIYFVLCCYGAKLDASNVVFQVVIDYWATFQEPRELPPSLSESIVRSLVDDALHQKRQEELTQGANGCVMISRDAKRDLVTRMYPSPNRTSER